jgi:hypothetical protein
MSLLFFWGQVHLPGIQTLMQKIKNVRYRQTNYLTVYPGECSTLPIPGEGEIPDNKTPEELLQCAVDSNAGLSQQVKFDGKDISSDIVKQSTSQPFAYLVPSEDNPLNTDHL